MAKNGNNATHTEPVSTADDQPVPDRPMLEAVDELDREASMRRRCYPRWVSEGRLSQTDARDRLERLETAARKLRKIVGLEDPY